MLKIIDLFSGIGGFRLAFHNLGAECVMSSEINKFARQTYKANWDMEPKGDITQINAWDIPDHDILCAGFPCQAFSIVGKRGGFEDSRGTLFFDVARIIREKRPKGVFLENVKGLVSHDKGKTLATILNALTEIGYHYDWRIINAKNFGVPQNRERIFIVAFDNKETLERFEWPEHSLKTVVFGDIRDDEAPTKYYHTPRYIAGMEAHKLRNLNKGNGFGYHIVEDDTIANTVTVGGTGRDRNWVRGEDKTKNELGLRNMTPREWARLQGYPDSFVFPVSDSQAYKQLGNSVAVPAIQAVAQKMIAAIG